MRFDLVLVGGGARCGKSRFALELGQQLGERRLFIATAEALDDEMADRIHRHQKERQEAFSFTTIEEPLALPELIASHLDADVVVIDCLTLWISNLLMAEHSDAAIAEQLDRLWVGLNRARHHTIVVSNEVGMSLVPTTALGRRFRDTVGRAHQQLSAIASRVYLAALGCVLQLTPTLAMAKPLAPGRKD